MDLSNKINEYLLIFKENYHMAKNSLVQEAKGCAGVIRTTLETAIKLLWLKKYDLDLDLIYQYEKDHLLYNAMVDSRFAELFDNITISDMHTIRKECNLVIHGKAVLTVELAQELLNRLERCVKKIESVIDVDLSIISNPDCHKSSTYIEAEQVKPTNKKNYSSNGSAEEERTIFWNMFEDVIDENGNPFFFSHRAHYAHINKSKLNSHVCLCLEFLVRSKLLRIGIYIDNDSQTRYYDRLITRKKEIEEILGFSPMWIGNCTKGKNTKRIAVELPFTPYDHEDYWRLIESALHKIVRYIDVCSIYLPEAFE